jgi:toxin ParE1/3/4
LITQSAARFDLRQIYEFSADTFGRRVAEAYLLGLRRTFDRLLEYPFIGAVYPNVTPEMRVILYRSHRIFYRVDDDIVLIVRILHTKRDETALFG